jgi:hypothetical protein
MVPYKPDAVQSGASPDAEHAAQASLASDQPQAPGVSHVTHDNNVTDNNSEFFTINEKIEGDISSGNVRSTNNKVTDHSDQVVGVMSREMLEIILSRKKT